MGSIFNFKGYGDHTCIERKFDYHSEVPGFPGCFIVDMVTNFFIASTIDVRAVGFDPHPLLSIVGHRGVRDPYTWRVRARTRPGYEPLRCPGRVQACTRLHTPPLVYGSYTPAQLVTGADISLVWAPVVRSRPKLFIPRCATSLAEAVTHGPNILCHSTALSRDTVYSPEGCTSYLRRVTCAGPYIPVHTTNYQVSGHVRRYHRPAHAVADISCTHPDTPGHAKFHGTCTGPETSGYSDF
ncbi:hypothetical protein Bbelb_021710 [Branchiostoma belcheri]|nr:hypothetical protein Bbelb_021710 [Branchiostoma belcheri]